MNDKEQLEKLGKQFLPEQVPGSIYDNMRKIAEKTKTNSVADISDIRRQFDQFGRECRDSLKGPIDGTQVKDPNTTTVRNDGGKNRVDLLPITGLEEVSKVLTAGASKYGENNWRPGMAWSRCYASCLRHLFAWWRGEDKDPETGLSHLGHAACNIFFLIDYQERKKGTDDRYIR